MFPSNLARQLYQMRGTQDSRVNKIEYIGEDYAIDNLSQFFDKSMRDSRFAEYITLVVLLCVIIIRIIQWANSRYTPPEEPDSPDRLAQE